MHVSAGLDWNAIRALRACDVQLLQGQHIFLAAAIVNYPLLVITHTNSPPSPTPYIQITHKATTKKTQHDPPPRQSQPIHHRHIPIVYSVLVLIGCLFHDSFLLFTSPLVVFSSTKLFSRKKKKGQSSSPSTPTVPLPLLPRLPFPGSFSGDIV